MRNDKIFLVTPLCSKQALSTGIFRGQTLVELLMALSVIIIGLTASAGVVFSNIRVQEISADRIVATNLAREGVEYTKSIRDSNWLANVAFDTNLHSGTDYTGVPVWVDAQFVGFDFTATDMDDVDWTTVKLSTNASTTGALYAQGPSYSGTDTLFQRLVTLQPICSDASVMSEGFSCISPLTTVGVRVTSRVSWSKRGVMRTSTIVDELYDWR